MKIIQYLSTLVVAVSLSVHGDEDLPLSTQIVQDARSECASFEGGAFDSTEQTILLKDLTGDGRPEEIVDASQFSCSTAASMWGGTGGTQLWVVVDGEKFEFLAHQWQVVEMKGKNILLLAVHSSQCSDTIGPCYRALVWDEGEFRTTR